VKVGDVLNLTCLVTNPSPNQGRVQWLVNDHLVTPRYGLSILSDTLPTTASTSLIIHSVQHRDGGTYRCATGGTDSAIVYVEIIADLKSDDGVLSSSIVVPLLSLLLISSLLLLLGVVTAVAAATGRPDNCNRERGQA